MQSSMVPLNVPLGAGGGAATVVVSMPEHPPDYAVWSVFSFVYGNPFCLGLIALIFSMKSRDHKMIGDMNGARMYGSKARYLNVAVLVFIIVSIIISIISLIVMAVASATAPSSYGSYRRY